MPKRKLPLASIRKHAKHAAANGAIRTKANGFLGHPKSIAEQVGSFVMQQVPNAKVHEDHKPMMFRRNAAELMKTITPVWKFHCVDRSTLALSLLHAADVHAWAVRGLGYSNIHGKWIFHDAVEFVHQGKVYLLDFFFDENRFTITQGSAESQFNKTHPGRHDIILRGIDAHHMGIKNWEEYERFSNRFFKDHQKELQENLARVRKMVRAGLIPKEVASELISRSQRHVD